MRDFDISLREKLKEEEFPKREKKGEGTFSEVIDSLKEYFSSNG